MNLGNLRYVPYCAVYCPWSPPDAQRTDDFFTSHAPHAFVSLKRPKKVPKPVKVC